MAEREPTLHRAGSAYSTMSTASMESGPPDSPTLETRRLSKTKVGERKYVNQYECLETLGRGASGKVKLVRNEAGAELALKIMKKSAIKKRGLSAFSNGPDFRKEIAIMKRLNHPAIVRLWEVIDDPEEPIIYLVMDLVSGGPAMSGMRAPPLSEEKCRSHFRSLAAGLDYLHFQGIVHRDIKPENLLVTSDGHLKICDFGIAVVLPNGDDDHIIPNGGSPMFVAPEGCMADSIKVSGKKMDVWAAGVTLYMFAYGRPPFEDASSMGELHRHICEQEIVFTGTVSAGLVDLLQRLLERDPEKRISIRDAMQHPWVTMEDAVPLVPVESPVLIRRTVTNHDIERAITSLDRMVLLTKMKIKMSGIRKRTQLKLAEKRRASMDEQALSDDEVDELESWGGGVIDGNGANRAGDAVWDDDEFEDPLLSVKPRKTEDQGAFKMRHTMSSQAKVVNALGDKSGEPEDPAVSRFHYLLGLGGVVAALALFSIMRFFFFASDGIAN